jgi:hypothetical protein
VAKHNCLQNFHQRKNKCFGGCPYASSQGVRIAHRPQAVTGLEPTTIVDGSTNTERLKVRGASSGSNDHSRSGDVSSPAKFEILAVE